MGGRSRAAAQLLSGKGFKEVYNLKGGINAWEGLVAEGPEEAGMLYLKGDETASEIIFLAYGMEAGLGSFYLKLAEMLDEPEVVSILTKLAGIEDKHKEKLYTVYSTLNPGVGDIEAFEAGISADVMEGGLTTDEFLTNNKAVMQTLEGVLSIAMMLEAQALDLYLRYSRSVKEEKSKAILYKIAEEEKAHLAVLGKLIDKHLYRLSHK
ncbi:MAG: sulfurtransferase [Deltaproteobacteria bacterium]|nr:sulfurtransferase [Deltaproteobacteria bacterium]